MEKISSSWRKKGDQLFIKVVISVNTTASVYLPVKDVSNVMECNK
jgi:hypothetical protein